MIQRTAVIITVLCINFFIQSHCQEEGEACVKDGNAGICTSLRKCRPALNDLRDRRSPKFCNSTGRIKVACCVLRLNPIAAKTFGTKTIATKTPTCPPIPASAVKIKKTGRKSKDRCIDWEELVQPCGRSVVLIPGAPKVRTDLCSHKVVSLIVGGTVAGKDEFPHMALLGFDNANTDEIIWACGGTLISERWVMTAGHCIFQYNASVNYVRLGSDDIGFVSDPQQMYTVEEIKPHPNYNFLSIYNDIALLKLNKDAKFSKSVIPACLHTESPSSIEKFIATGWGDVDRQGKKTKKLVKVTLEQFNFTECARKLPATRTSRDGVRAATQVCAGHHTRISDTCQGDSGGPLQIYNLDVYCTYTVVGVVSTGRGCGTPGRPALYTRVSAFIPWIESIVWP